MRPKEQVQSSAGDGTGSGDPAAGTPATQPAASPTPEPSAEPKPAPAQGTGSGQRAPGSRTRTGSFCRSMIIGNSDAPWTRYVFQGPYGPRATGLGTGKAEGIWKTPAAYIGRRPGVSGPERAAFIRELQEGKLNLWDPALAATRASPGRKKGPTTQEPRPPVALTPTFPPPRETSVRGACLVSFSPLSGSTNFAGASGSGLARSSPPLRACCCGRSAHSQCPLPIYRSASRGAGAAGVSCWSRSEPALARGTSMRGWVERELLTTKWLQGSGSCFPGAGLRREEWAGHWASVPPSSGRGQF